MLTLLTLRESIFSFFHLLLYTHCRGYTPICHRFMYSINAPSASLSHPFIWLAQCNLPGWRCCCIRVYVCMLKHNSPFIKITGIHTGSSSAKVFAGEALVGAGTPTPCVRTQLVTHHVVLGCSVHTYTKRKTVKEHRITFRMQLCFDDSVQMQRINPKLPPN